MTETIEVLVRRVVSAMAHVRADDVVEGVKTAVADSLRQADPNAKVSFTRWFNHSYNPDMTVTWPKGEAAGERSVFLRGSLAAAIESEDLPNLSERTPIVIGLKPEKRRVLDALRPRFRQTRGALAAEVSSVAALSGQPRSVRSESSLSTLVRRNLLQEGQGFLDGHGAARIADVDRRTGAASARALKETVDELFIGQAGARLSKTAALLLDLFDPSKSREVAAQLTEVPLNDAELGVLLPQALLAPAEVEEIVWRALGASVTLARLENLAQSLGDHDLTPLIAVNARRIAASRAQLAVNAHLVEEEEPQPIADIARWRMRERRLAAELGDRILYVVSDARKLKTPGAGVDARWDEVGSHLDGLELMSVALHGLSDQFNVAGQDPTRVSANVDRLRQAIQDDFHVPRVRVRENSRDLDGLVEVDFESMRMDRVAGEASLRAFVLAAPLLSRRDPIPARLIASLLNEDEEL